MNVSHAELSDFSGGAGIFDVSRTIEGERGVARLIVKIIGFARGISSGCVEAL
ncbi:MAG: hypothetical protein QM778_27795 [Myxococcales bacterium]